MATRVPLYLNPTTGNTAVVPAGDKLGGVTGGTATGEVMTQDQFGANSTQMTTTGVPQFAGIKTDYVYPAADSTTAWSVRKADAATHVVTVDTTNSRIGVGCTPGVRMHCTTNSSGADREIARFENLNSSTASVAYIQVKTPNTSCSLNAYDANYTGVAGYADFGAFLSGDAGLLIAASNAAGIIKFFTSSSTAERMRIASTGNVAINTTTTTLGRFTSLDASAPQLVAANTVNEWLGITVGSGGTTTYAITSAGAKLHSFSDPIAIGGGSSVKKALFASATLDFGSTAAQSSSTLTITVTGAADGDCVALGVPSGSQNANSCYTASVTAANTVTVTFNNYSSGSIDPASGTFKVWVFQG